MSRGELILDSEAVPLAVNDFRLSFSIAIVNKCMCDSINA